MSSITAATLTSMSCPISIRPTGCPIGSWPWKSVLAIFRLMTALLASPFHASLLPSVILNENMSKKEVSAMPKVPSTMFSPELISMDCWLENVVDASISGYLCFR